MSTAEIPKIMDLDTAYIEPLIHEWLEHVHQENAKQEEIFSKGDEFIIPYMAVPLPVIRTIFVIAGHLGLGPNTRYLTVHLFDRFMCNNFCKMYAAETNEGTRETNSWTNVCKTISGEAKLRLMSCMQLASKMDSHSKGLGISQVMRMLRWLDDKSEYTRNAVYSSEFSVFKTVDFKIPLFTPLHCVEILLAATKLGKTPDIYAVCVNLLDLAYLQHDRIYSRLQFMIRQRYLESEIEPGNVSALESNILYLGAAVVLCSIFFLSIEDSDAVRLVKKLSNLVGIAENNIWELAKLLFTMAVKEHSP